MSDFGSGLREIESTTFETKRPWQDPYSHGYRTKKSKTSTRDLSTLWQGLANLMRLAEAASSSARRARAVVASDDEGEEDADAASSVAAEEAAGAALVDVVFEGKAKRPKLEPGVAAARASATGAAAKKLYCWLCFNTEEDTCFFL